MIDPSDNQLLVYRDGDAEALPTPTGGDMGEVPIGNVPTPTGTEIRMFDLHAVDIGIGLEIPIRARDKPHFWLVSVANDATTTVSIWPYDAPAGPPIRLERKGRAVFAGLAQSIWVRNTGPVIARITAIAIRGYEAEVMVDWGG